MKKIKIGDCFDWRIQSAVVVAESKCEPSPIHGNNRWWCQMVSYDGQNRWEDIMWPCDHEPIPTLHLPISEPWFSKILSGEKLEEYRDCKPFYESRLSIKIVSGTGKTPVPYGNWPKVLHLTNGYGHHRPQLWVHIEEIAIGKGKPEWGAPEEDVFIITLGKVFHTKNLNKGK